MATTHGGFVTDGNIRQNEQLGQRLFELLVDKAYFRNWSAGGQLAFTYMGSVNGTMADTHKVRYWNGSATDLVDATEIAALTPVDPTTASVTIAVARKALMREHSYLAQSTGGAQDLDVNRLAADMATSYERTWNNMATTAFQGVTETVQAGGVANQAFDVDTLLEGIYALEEADADSATAFGALGRKQVTDFQRSLRVETGALEYQAPTAQMLALKGQGFIGTYLGVELFKSSFIRTSAGDDEGCLWIPGAFGWKNATVVPASTTKAIFSDGLMCIEKESIPGEAKTQIVANAWLGMSLLEQARAVKLTSRTLA